jgi:hypothetical protein
MLSINELKIHIYLNKKFMFNVLVACYAKWDATAEVPFILKRAGCNVDIFCSKTSWLLANSYYDNWFDAGENNLLYKEHLLDLVKRKNYDWIILGDDVLINYMNQEIQNEALFVKILPLTKIENRKILSSKLGLSDFCIEKGIDTPGYVMYNDLNDLNLIKEKLNFPVINKLDFSFGGTDMFISHSFEELQENTHKLPIGQNLLVQEFVTGEEIPVEALFYKGKLLVYLNSNVLKYSSSNFSYTTRKKYYNNEALLPILEQLGSELGLNGFANMLYIYDKGADKYYLIEVDPRPNSWMAYGRFITNNTFSDGVKRIMNGDYINGYHGMKIKKPEVEVALFYKDIKRVIWKKDLNGGLNWIFNHRGYWRFLPFYDLKLTRRIFSNLWSEVVGYKWKKFRGKI